MAANPSSQKNDSRDTILLIDSNALVHRAYHSYPPTLTTADGDPINAVYGFTKLLFETIGKFHPKYIVCVFDASGPTFRHDMYSEYKATRKKMDDELRVQFPRAREIVRTLNIPLFEQKGFEADDLIGTLVSGKINDGLQKIIVTGDHDILQLVDDTDHTSVYMAGSSFSQSKLYEAEQVKARYEFSPPQIIDYKALMGDPSDNIPGVRGIGKKGATDLIKQFTTVEAIYESLEKDEVIWHDKPFKRMYKKLAEGREQAGLSKELATIKLDIDLDFDLEDAETVNFDEDKVKDLFQELQFRSLYRKLDELRNTIANASDASTPVGAPPAPAPVGGSKSVPKPVDKPAVKSKTSNAAGPQMSIFDSASSAEMEAVDKLLEITEGKGYKIIEDITTALAVLKEIDATGKFVFKTESGPDIQNYMDAELSGLGFSTSAEKAFYFTKGVLADSKVRERLERLFAVEHTKISHNLKYDLHVMVNYFSGYFPGGLEALPDTSNSFDTMIAVYLLGAGDPSRGKKLSDLVFSYFGIDMHLFENLPSKIPPEALGQNCSLNCDVTFRLYEIFSNKLASSGNEDLLNLFKEIEMPLVGVLLSMEREGISLDTKILHDLHDSISGQLLDIQNQIYDKAGVEFNIASPKQVGEVLFEKMKIQEGSGIHLKKTKTGAYSTGERTLSNFAVDHEIVRAILLHRELSKLQTTYVLALEEQVNANTKKVHTSYNQTVTATGRLSSSDPNLQNIPVSSETGRKIRQAFLVREDDGKPRRLLAFDYAQQELRLLAHLSEEEKLISAFQDGLDIHTLTASEILGVPQDQVTKQQRRVGKTVNFGVVYGISGFGLSDNLKIERKAADEFIAKFYNQYPKIRDYFDGVKNQAKEAGLVYTLLGRKRDARGLNDKNFQVRRAVEREVLNFPLQGGAADIMKMAMIAVHEHINDENYVHKSSLKMHLQVHDEIILSVPADMSMPDLRRAAAEIEKLMETVYELKVPVAVDAEYGDNWYELKDLE